MTTMLPKASGGFILLLLALMCLAQTPSPPQGARGVVKLRVRVKEGEAIKGLARKRFFLMKGSLEQNKGVIVASEQSTPISRDCYFRSAGASEALINWLKANDCESVYCREIQPEDIEGPAAVPEFVNAVNAGEKELGSKELSRQWLAVNLPEKLRSGFYKARQNELDTLIKKAEATSGSKLHSVMTDRKGIAYFTDLEPGTYTISNLIQTETGATTLAWNCEVQVKPGDLATEKAFLISNRKEVNVKCVAVEKPLPVCESTPK
jgi:hypothetical protein